MAVAILKRVIKKSRIQANVCPVFYCCGILLNIIIIKWLFQTLHRWSWFVELRISQWTTSFISHISAFCWEEERPAEVKQQTCMRDLEKKTINFKLHNILTLWDNVNMTLFVDKMLPEAILIRFQNRMQNKGRVEKMLKWKHFDDKSEASMLLYKKPHQ